MRLFPVFIASALFLLAITPVYASPNLSLGSTASYNLSGNVNVSQTCSTNPPMYTSQACYGTGYPTNSYVAIYDDSHCAPPTASDPFSGLKCRFAPQNITVTSGDIVIWNNYGNLTHTVVANTTANLGLPAFASGSIYSGGSFSFQFNQVGSYHYYDSIYGQLFLLMRGTVNVSPQVTVTPPTPMSFQVGFTGSLGWKIIGLSPSQANLLVSHSTALSVSPPGIPLSFTPLTESGSFEQSVNLSTRVESPGTASSLVKTVLSTYLQGVSRLLTGTGQYGGYQLPVGDLTDEPSYTQWWVNGPLSNGSPVQILQGWSSVTGSNSIDLGGGIGTRQAWIVTSNLDQSFNLNIPNVSNPLGQTSTSTASANIGFQWSFDKGADLLLRNNDTISFRTRSTAPTTIYTGSASIDVAITRTMSVTVTLTIQLSSSSLNLNGSQQTPALNPLSPMSWMSVGLVGLAAGVVSGALLWQGYRTRRSAAPVEAPNPAPY